MITVSFREPTTPDQLKTLEYPLLFPEETYRFVVSGISEVDAVTIEEEISGQTNMVVAIRFVVRRLIFGRQMFRHFIKRYSVPKGIGGEYQLS